MPKQNRQPAQPRSAWRDEGTVQRPDLAGIHGTGPTEETHADGEHKPSDTQDGSYVGEHGTSLPRPKGQRRD